MRLGWSPDAHYIVSAHAMNNSGPVAQIIERTGWKTSMDFVGHRKAVTAVVRHCSPYFPVQLVKRKVCIYKKCQFLIITLSSIAFQSEYIIQEVKKEKG